VGQDSELDSGLQVFDTLEKGKHREQIDEDSTEASGDEQEVVHIKQRGLPNMDLAAAEPNEHKAVQSSGSIASDHKRKPEPKHALIWSFACCLRRDD
jgi:hypothetical protein